MIIDDLRLLDDISPRAAWQHLMRFQNVDYTRDLIIKRHRVPAKFRKFVEKQAVQIRFCLAQAQEYFRAASTVTIATKPLLLYYGMMSLALAELLFKQDGESSLDRSRKTDAHHGLTFSLTGDPAAVRDISQSAKMLRAMPAIRSKGGRRGTFDLWHRSARESPIFGKSQAISPAGAKTESQTILLTAADIRLPQIPDGGISLLECLEALPTLRQVAMQVGVKQHILRATFSKDEPARLVTESKLVLQPSSEDMVQEFFAAWSIHPEAVNSDLNFTDLKTGGIITWSDGIDRISFWSTFPNAMQIGLKELFFLPRSPWLNEFGLYYAALFILGNYARYYPDFWMLDVERSSDLAVLATELMSVAESRGPLLAASELSGCGLFLRP